MASPARPRVVAGLRLVRRVGEGGEGEVWEARDRAGRQRALKLIRPDALVPPAEVERRGRWLLAIDHPALVAVHRCGVLAGAGLDGWGFVEMAFVDGRALDDAEADPDALVRLAPLAEALDLLHAGAWSDGVPLVHRDVKPANLIEDADGQLVLVDASTLRDVDDGTRTRIGTPLYAAPEVVTGRAGPLADVYGFAATAVALLTGARRGVLADLLHHPEGLDVPAGLRAALADDPADRPVSCRAALDPALPLVVGREVGWGPRAEGGWEDAEDDGAWSAAPAHPSEVSADGGTWGEAVVHDGSWGEAVVHDGGGAWDHTVHVTEAEAPGDGPPAAWERTVVREPDETVAPVAPVAPAAPADVWPAVPAPPGASPWADSQGRPPAAQVLLEPWRDPFPAAELVPTPTPPWGWVVLLGVLAAVPLAAAATVPAPEDRVPAVLLVVAVHVVAGLAGRRRLGEVVLAPPLAWASLLAIRAAPPGLFRGWARTTLLACAALLVGLPVGAALVPDRVDATSALVLCATALLATGAAVHAARAGRTWRLALAPAWVLGAALFTAVGLLLVLPAAATGRGGRVLSAVARTLAGAGAFVRRVRPGD